MEDIKALGVLDVRNGSVELFFDDEGLIQKAIFRERKRKPEGERITVHEKPGAVCAKVDFTPEGLIGAITYERVWRRKLA